MPKIVISYRRQDSEAVTGRIRDRLVGRYSAESVFMDIDSIPPGVNFRDYIADALRQTDLFLAIIGPGWCGERKGQTRINHPSDPVRIEVEKALELKIPVWPVLVNDADIPEPSSLPESLQSLSEHNAAFVASGRDFHPHMDRLIRQIDRLLGTPGGSPGKPAAVPTVPEPSPGSAAAAQSHRTPIVLVTGAIAVILVVAIGMFLWRTRPNTTSAVSTVTTNVSAPARVVPCSEESTLRSLGTKTSTSILFVNKSGRQKRLYWLSHEGKRVHYYSLESGQSVLQQTFISHPWVVADAPDRCEAIHMPAPDRQEVVITK